MKTASLLLALLAGIFLAFEPTEASCCGGGGSGGSTGMTRREVRRAQYYATQSSYAPAGYVTQSQITYQSGYATQTAPAGYTAMACPSCPGGICYVQNQVAAAPAVQPGVNCACVAAYGYCPCTQAKAAVPAAAPAATTYGDPFSKSNKITTLPSGKKMICDGDKCYILSEVAPQSAPAVTPDPVSELVVASHADPVKELVASVKTQQDAVTQLVQATPSNAVHDLISAIQVARND